MSEVAFWPAFLVAILCIIGPTLVFDAFLSWRDYRKQWRLRRHTWCWIVRCYGCTHDPKLPKARVLK